VWWASAHRRHPITVNQIVILYKQGHSAEDIADEYPRLAMAQTFAALAHYNANQDEIEADLEAERKEINDQSNALTGSLEREIWLKAFQGFTTESKSDAGKSRRVARCRPRGAPLTA
jgi:hypothetical protein